MNLGSHDVLQIKPFFNSTKKALLFGILTAVMLIAAYMVPWLNWLVWIAFVPLMLSVKGRKPLMVYLITSLPTLIYIIFAIYISGISQYTSSIVQFIILTITFLIMIPSIYIASRFFGYYQWVVMPFVWTILILVLGLFYHVIVDYLICIFSIILVSQSIFRSIAGTYGGYGSLIYHYTN